MQLFHASSRAQKSLRQEIYICIYTHPYKIYVYIVHLYIEKRISVGISIHAHLRYAVVSHFEPRAKVAPKRNIYMYIHTPIYDIRVHAYVYIYTYTCKNVYLYVYTYMRTFGMQLFHTSSRAYKSLWRILRYT